MSRIAFIAPTEQLLERARITLSDMGLEQKIEVHLAILQQGVDLARRLEAEGVDVIICRGGTAEMIIDSGVRTPVVSIPYTSQDLALVLSDAKRLTGLENPCIAFPAFDNMIADIEVLSHIMGINLLIYRLKTPDDITGVIETIVAENKADIILGGLITCRVAQERGLKVLLVASGDASFRAACLEAQKVAYARKIEKERTEQFRVLVDYSIDGIISVDREKKIQVFNPAAERILSISADSVVGSTIDNLFPSFQVDECLRSGTEYVDEIIPFQHIKIMANVAPIRVGRDISGVMITFQDTSHIAELEVKIRKELYTKGLTAKYHFQHILGVSPEITESRRIALQFSEIDATVLITGASGTGKELFAQSIHNRSGRKKGPFVAVNCAALPPNLLESELFGYVEGAFTGANRKGKPGLFELAHSGTIFLDEISEMDRYGQSRLLRVLQEKQVMRLGDDKVIPIDVRVIAATNKNLRALVARSDFREDLFYRLNVLHFSLPVLRERTGDVRFLADHFIKQCQTLYKKRVEYDEAVLSVLEKYDWPGNVRELHNVLERLVIIARNARITQSDAIAVLEHDIAGLSSPHTPLMPLTGLPSAEEPAERDRIIEALKHSGYNQTDAAKKLGMDRSTLYRKIRRYGIDWKLL